MEQKIKTWHILNYPSDELAKNMDSEITFEKLWKGLKEGIDVYRMLGVCDSLIRERVFNGLAKKMGVEYETVYNTWLGE